MKTRLLGLMLAGLTAAGCSTLTPKQQEKLDDMSNCEKLNALLSASSNGFSTLKGAEVGAKLINSWQAKAHLIGNKCQIIESTSGESKYTCSEQFKEYENAVKIHNYAQSLAKQCLDHSWVGDSQQNGPLMHTQISSSNATSKITIELGKGLDKVTPWVVTFNVTEK
ncbi:hypothetical protein [Pseudoalteromonas piscicida]|uniref:Lipoprotein n=1 Tax=Pseudoalteromonas piscicida TaxID=43662 RepID=A0AAD0W677_PSEO7|nr:hypothetical protein [Pseudoalteromonas piscicida]ASD69280.1 hypothetical protein B1L02_20510 [Pseudoalteromonas piscicida]AXR04356.1 hypothetical protein D0511_20790 [Pseudoalteromonas piscicida]